ncbi:MAG: BCCT family transporter [Egibacteraceae bacterium]
MATTEQHASSEKQSVLQQIHPVVFGVSATLIVAFVTWGAVFTETANEVLGDVLAFITDNFGWLFITGIAVFIVFCLTLVLGRNAKVRLGPDDSRPDYSYATWFAMLFSAGMGIGLLFWGVAEPMWHYMTPPAEDAETMAAAADAMVWTYHHWGIGPWAMYAVLALSLAYFGFRHNLPLTVRAAFYPLIGDRIYGPIGNAVDILAVLGTLVGVAVSLGLGAMQVNAGLDYVFGIGQSIGIQMAIIAVITAAATISVVSGLDKGIRLLSQTNLVLAGLLLLFVAAVGPTVMLISGYVENLGNYLQDFFRLIFASGTYADDDLDGFLGAWTLFYWAWWISWAPFVGMFIARISRGRTIREFVLGVLLVPTLVSFLWFTVMGNTAIDVQASGAADIWGAIENAGESVAMFAMLESFPLFNVTAVVAILVIVFFFVTSSDSGSFVIDILSTGGNPNPPIPTRVFWALSEGFVAAILLYAGGDLALSALQAGAVATGLPFTVVLLFVVAGLWKGLRAERKGVSIEDIPEQPFVGDGEEAYPEGVEDPELTAAAERLGEPDDGTTS